MNKKGSLGSIMLISLFAIAYFMFGMIMYQFLKTPIDSARTSIGCSSVTDWGDKGMCLVISSVVPIAIITILSVSGGIITDRMLK